MHNQFTNALVRVPAPTAHQGLTSRGHLGLPDTQLTLDQHAAYIQALLELGVEVKALDPSVNFPDGHFVEDVAVIYRDLAFITNPGAPSRREEVVATKDALPQQHRVELGGDGYLEGGDVLYLADDVVLIGVSERTNRDGAECLKAALLETNPGVKVGIVPLTGVLHLKTGMTELAPGILLKSPKMQTDFDFSPYGEVITLPIEEEYAACVLPINDGVLIAKGFPTVAELASKYYSKVYEIPMTEFEKMDGSLTCLSLRYVLP